MTATLKIKVIQVRNLMGKKSSKNEAQVVIKVDSDRKAATKSRNKLQWDEEFTIHCEKASEIEFSVMDKTDGLLSLLFFKLSDLEAQVAEGMQMSENDSEGYEGEWAMEPAGEIRLKFSFGISCIQTPSNTYQPRNKRVTETPRSFSAQLV